MARIEIPEFGFHSDLTRALFDCERERSTWRAQSLKNPLVDEIAQLFQLLSSITSARIEGNRTTLLDAVRGTSVHEKVAAGAPHSEGVREIRNLEAALRFIDKHVPDTPMDHRFIRELHRIVVTGLGGEGDPTPGAYRQGPVTIVGSDHQPPQPSDVLDHMSEVVAFLSRELTAEEALLQMALVHHRLLWIHPFGNGNGRVARLVAYAMVVAITTPGEIPRFLLNPTAVFGADRNRYYDALGQADSLSDEGLLSWCTYVIRGMANDMASLSRLGQHDFLLKEILLPALDKASENGAITIAEAALLRFVARHQVVRAGDLEPLIPGSPATRSQRIRKYLDAGLLVPVTERGRLYCVGLTGNSLTLSVIRTLEQRGLLPTIFRGE